MARANTPFPDRIAHGVMTTALMSNPLVQFCERYRIRTALLTSSSRYLRPVVAGDTVTTRIRLVEKIDAKNRIRFEVEATNQRGEVVMLGEMLEQALERFGGIGRTMPGHDPHRTPATSRHAGFGAEGR